MKKLVFVLICIFFTTLLSSQPWNVYTRVKYLNLVKSTLVRNVFTLGSESEGA